MLVVYLDRKIFEPREVTLENKELLKEAVWVDLISPTAEEAQMVSDVLALELPTRDEMAEIQASSRLYRHHHKLYMTAAMLAQAHSTEPKFDPISFILTENQLITIRYIEPHSFRLFASQLSRLESTHRQASTVLIGLLDMGVERLADTLELVGHRLDNYSKAIFKTSEESLAPNLDRAENIPEKLDFQSIMQQIGLNGTLVTKVRESLMTLNRLVTFFEQMMAEKITHEQHIRLVTVNKDIASLIDHAHFIASKTTFLLDATLGMLNIEQNNIIKIFSVAAVIFLPPTLIASIYGMNFQHIPELTWPWGYYYSLAMMALAAILPYKYFKHRKWL